MQLHSGQALLKVEGHWSQNSQKMGLNTIFMMKLDDAASGDRGDPVVDECHAILSATNAIPEPLVNVMCDVSKTVAEPGCPGRQGPAGAVRNCHIKQPWTS